MGLQSTLGEWRERMLRWQAARRARPLGGRPRGVDIVLSRARAWWRESLSFVAPFVIVAALGFTADIFEVAVGGPSIGTVAAVQGAVTGLSLIALVLAVELARRQEEHDDTIYEIMLHTAWIRPTFSLAVSALLATTTAMALSTYTTQTSDSNLLLSAYVLTGFVALALLVAVWRTIHVLRPTGVIEHRFDVNERERRKRVVEYIAGHPEDRPSYGNTGSVGQVEMAVSLIATDRLFVEVEEALQHQQASRLRWALDRLRLLIEASAEQIETAEADWRFHSFPRYDPWFPLDAISERLYQFWRAASEQPQDGHLREMWRFQRWLVTTGISCRRFELVELGLKACLTASEVGVPTTGQRRSDWLQNLQHNWSSLADLGIDRDCDHEITETRYRARLATHLQDLGGLFIKRNDAAGFSDMAVTLQHAVDLLRREWRRRTFVREIEGSATPELFEQTLLALLALYGRAMLAGETNSDFDSRPYVDSLQSLIGESASTQRELHATFDLDGPVQGQWGGWQYEDRAHLGASMRRVERKTYVILALLAQLIVSPKADLEEVLAGHAQAMLDSWNRHADTVCLAAGVGPDDRDITKDAFEEQLRRAAESDWRADEERIRSTPVDPMRLSAFVSEARRARQDDRVLEHLFSQSGRVVWRDEAASDAPQSIAYSWFANRGPLVIDSDQRNFAHDMLVFGFEPVLFKQMATLSLESGIAETLEASSLAQILTGLDCALGELKGPDMVIVAHGHWGADLFGQFEAYVSREASARSNSIGRWFPQMVGTYRGFRVLKCSSSDTHGLVVCDLNNWGNLVRSKVVGEDIGVWISEITDEDAERRADEDSVKVRFRSLREWRIQQLTLHVEVTAKEHSEFEVEDPMAIRMIRLVTEQGEPNGEGSLNALSGG